MGDGWKAGGKPEIERVGRTGWRGRWREALGKYLLLWITARVVVREV
jgi:hypothetical protein